MEKGIDTGFKDKSGKVIHIDDIIQYRLGKSGGTKMRVIKVGKKYRLVTDSYYNSLYGGTAHSRGTLLTK